jgi:hypothetical protein
VAAPASPSEIMKTRMIGLVDSCHVVTALASIRAAITLIAAKAAASTTALAAAAAPIASSAR